jgi:hypothetical protein
MIHATPSVSATAQELISHTQDATNTWGGFAIVTGAALKPEKCFAYILKYKFINGHAVIGGMKSLPTPSAMIPQNEGTPLPSHLTVPLPDGTCAPIPTIPNTTASLTLGIWHAPSSRGTKHMKEMCSRGHNWVDRLCSRPLPHLEAWISFTHQLYPGMIWGLVTVVLLALELFATTRPVYFKCLPLLGIQSHIKLPWRTLPEAYQGIGLPNFALHSCAAKLQLIQCNWGFNNTASKGLFMGYKSFFMNVQMYGNILDLDYKSYSGLAVN